MTEFNAIQAIGAQLTDPTQASIPAQPTQDAPALNAPRTQGSGFAEMLGESLATLESRIDHANTMVQRFAIDDSVPIHQVTMALGQARLSVELATQIRTQVVESYRQIMNMQI